jgi:hypothetical protein
MTIDKNKGTKHTRCDEKRKSLPRLPSSRIKDKAKAQIMEELYLVDEAETKLNIIADAAQFALENKAQFTKFRQKLHANE